MDVFGKRTIFPKDIPLTGIVKSPIIRQDVFADGFSEIIPEIRTEIPWRCNREKLEGELRNSARNEVQFLSLSVPLVGLLYRRFQFPFSPSPLSWLRKRAGFLGQSQYHKRIHRTIDG